MSHCYLVLAHTLPDQLARLLGALRFPGVRFFIHVDAKVEIDAFHSRIGDAPDVHWLEDRVEVHWAGWSQVEAMLALVKAALDHAPEARRLTLVSGACYPVASNQVLSDLVDRPAQFINARLIEPGSPGYERIGRYHLPDHPLLNPRTPRTLIAQYLPLRRYVDRFLEDLPDMPPLGMDYYKGSQWFSLTADAARYMLDFTGSRQEVVRIFRYSWVPDESYFQSVLGNSPFASRLRRRLHYISFTRESVKRGKLLGMDDLPAILESGCRFIRKVSPDYSGALMDELDRRRAAGTEVPV